MSTRRRRLAGGRAALVVAVTCSVLAPALAVPALASPPVPAAPAPSSAAPPVPVDPLPSSAAVPGDPEEEAAFPVEVLVTRLLPRAPQTRADAFQVAGSLTNRGAEPVRRLEVQLRVAERLRSRGQLAEADAEPAPGVPVVRVDLPPELELAPGASIPFDVRTTVGVLGLGEIGIYPLGVAVRGEVGQEKSTTPVGVAPTYVPWFPDGVPRPTRLAWLVPLMDVPLPPGSPKIPELLAPTGRLGQQLAAVQEGTRGACDPPAAIAPPRPSSRKARTPAPPRPPCRPVPVPVALGLDPQLLEAARVAATLPAAAAPSATPSPAPAAPPAPVDPAREAAASWLAALRQLASGSEVVGVPYADPDVVAITRGSAPLRPDLDVATVLGQNLLGELVGRAPLSQVAWPPSGQVTAAARDALAAAGARTLILDAAAVPASDQPATPTARRRLSPLVGAVDALVVDAPLVGLLRPQPGAPPGDRLAEQRWIVETAMIAAEGPSRPPRTLLAALPRRAAVDPDVLREVLLDTGRLPWLCPVTLSAAAAETATCPDEPPPVPSALPAEPTPSTGLLPVASGQPLSPTRIRALARLRGLAVQFVTNVLQPSPEREAIAERLLRTRLRAESAAWRQDTAGGTEALAAAREGVEALRDGVTVVPGKPRTLTSTSGTILVDVENRLDQPVRVGVRLSATAARLTTVGSPSQVILPRRRVQVRVDVQARTSGRFVVEAQLVDAANRPLGPPRELVLRSTGYGRSVLAVTFGGLAVLFGAAGYRIVRRALRSRRPAATTPGA